MKNVFNFINSWARASFLVFLVIVSLRLIWTVVTGDVGLAFIILSAVILGLEIVVAILVYLTMRGDLK